jgi:hypothetical protein
MLIAATALAIQKQNGRLAKAAFYAETPQPELVGS